MDDEHICLEHLEPAIVTEIDGRPVLSAERLDDDWLEVTMICQECEEEITETYAWTATDYFAKKGVGHEGPRSV